MNKLEILNSISVLDSDIDCELISILIESSKENVEKLLSIGVTNEEIQESINTLDEAYDYIYPNGVIELVTIPSIWNIAGGYSYSEGFVSTERIEELTNEEKEQYIPSKMQKVFAVYKKVETRELGESVDTKLFYKYKRALSFFKNLVSNEKKFLKDNSLQEVYTIVTDTEDKFYIFSDKHKCEVNISIEEETVY